MDQEKRLRCLKALEKRGFSPMTAARTIGGGALKSLPLIGNIYSGGSALYNLAKGNWGSAALDAAGMIPGYGNAIQFGRMGYELGKGLGGAQAQPQMPSPVGLPNYGKMASNEITQRGLSFEAGVERFCKEASFDDADRQAMYSLMVKHAEDPIPADTGLANYNEGTGNVNPWLAPSGDPRLGAFTNFTDWVGNAFKKRGWNAFKDLIDAPMASYYQSQDRAREAIEMDKLHKTNPMAWQQKMDQRRRTGSASSEQQKLDMDTAFNKAKDLQGQFPHASNRQIASIAFKGLGPSSTLMRQEFLARMRETNNVPGGGMPPAPSPMPGTGHTSPPPPPPANSGRTAPPGPSGGYVSGTPAATAIPK